MNAAMRTPSPLAPILADAATGECRRALRALGDARQRHRGIHEARKSLRRLKSLLRLGAVSFAESLPSLEKAIDRLAVGLSPLRDAHVAVETARMLAGKAEGSGTDTEAAGNADADAWARAIEQLASRSEGRLAAALIKDPGFQGRRHEVGELARRVEALPWQRLTVEEIEFALAHSERRVAKARKRMRKAATVANLHRWRRRARRLRMQLELLRKARKAASLPTPHHAGHHKALAKGMSSLSDAIGARQDLRLLREVLRTVADADTAPALVHAASRALKAHRMPADAPGVPGIDTSV
jgi:CHAD domain-containing protein